MSVVHDEVKPRADLSSDGITVDDAIVRWATDKVAATGLEELRVHLGADAAYLQIGYHKYALMNDDFARFYETKIGLTALELVRRLTRQFVARLLSGDPVARGIPEGTTNEEWIPPKFWYDVKPDALDMFLPGRVVLGVATYRCVRFFDPAARVAENVVLAGPGTRTGKSKGTAPATLHAIAAIAAVIYDEKPFPRKAATLAIRAADKAQELGLEGADALNPKGSSMRDIANAFLKGIEKAEAADTG